MAVTIIVKDGKARGDTRTGVDRRLIDAGWGSSFKSEEDRDKCAFVERQLKKKLNADATQVPAAVYNRMGEKKKEK